jgi:sugar phosphate isomerase/epimerase
MEDLALGVVTWSKGDPIEAIKWVKSMDVLTMQLGCPPEEYFSNAKRQELVEELTASGIRITVIFCAYEGEDYSRVIETIGLTNPALREERIIKTYKIADLANDLGVDKIGAHVGPIPEERTDTIYQGMVEAVRKIVDYCRKNDQFFLLETGQEPAEVLLHFIQDVGRDNLGINFDPANLILYGSGDPIQALEILKEHVLGVHVKDARFPKNGDLFQAQKRLGEGDVDIVGFIKELKKICYRGPLTIEREVRDKNQQTKDVLDAKIFLEKLCARI